MSDLLGVTAIIILSFLGLIGVCIGIVFLYLAYRYDISFSINTKAKADKELAQVLGLAPGTGKKDEPIS